MIASTFTSDFLYLLATKYLKTIQIKPEVTAMELVEIRHELENTAKRLADFRGSL
ncbi:hypothetical protein [Metabacillus rhizolycopersici]|uniref:Uncharacterized protein n=1 Tax=Metabacillus rhizolycopersici TaxID=2875709 RepID=A0ABS7UVR3_9BACI|nr:hypothetical protein [Metabacillus rhizolycopersici]MBZ5752142.1 hypothetical protein [Metabacillus rhizolycopersici]